MKQAGLQAVQQIAAAGWMVIFDFGAGYRAEIEQQILQSLALSTPGGQQIVTAVEIFALLWVLQSLACLLFCAHQVGPVLIGGIVLKQQ